MPLHPQAAAVLGPGPQPWRDLAVIEAMTAEKSRALVADATRDAARALPPQVAVEQIELPGPAGKLRGRVYRPRAAAPVGTVLWIRGGGFVNGSLEIERAPGPLALASGCAIVSVEYRLAPEDPFPAALEDCYAALTWAAEHAHELGGHAGPVAVGGESAGGNLAAAVALLARERGGPPLALQVLVQPMLSREPYGESRRDPNVGVVARPEAIDWLWRQYLGDRDGSDPFACPLAADNLAGLPPALVVTAEYDTLRDEGEAYARRLERAGVPVELRRYDGMHHGFAEHPEEIDAARECVEHIAATLRRALAPEDGAYEETERPRG
jgi:acetyl esterase